MYEQIFLYAKKIKIKCIIHRVSAEMLVTVFCFPCGNIKKNINKIVLLCILLYREENSCAKNNPSSFSVGKNICFQCKIWIGNLIYVEISLNGV